MTNSKIFFWISKIFSDFFAIFIAWILGYFLRLEWDFLPFIKTNLPASFPEIKILFLFFLASAFWFILISWINWQYKFESQKSRLKTFFEIFYNLILWCLLIIAFYALLKHELFFSRVYLFQVFILSFFFVIFFRYLFKKIEIFYLKKWKWVTQIYLIWSWKFLENIKRNLPLQYKIFWEFKKFDKNFLKKHKKNFDEIWILDSTAPKKELIDFCQINWIWFKFIANEKWVLLSHLETVIISWVPLLSVIPTSIVWWQRIYKRVLDLIWAIILLIILTPLFLILWIFIKIDSEWPIFYWSIRVWKDWKLFKMWKFRSMIINAEKLKKELLDKNHRKWPLFKIKWDPRITHFWHILRRFSIDELPQIFNVLKWEVSFVWPRAHLPDEVKNYTELQKRVLIAKPWITGLAQINWRSDLEFEDEIKFDLQYIQNWTFLLDLQILIQTPIILLKWNWAD